MIKANKIRKYYVPMGICINLAARSSTRPKDEFVFVSIYNEFNVFSLVDKCNARFAFLVQISANQ
jgi:hypothetical protein